MNKRIRKKQRERARRESVERYRQNPTADALLEHYERFGEVLTPIPEEAQEAFDAANRFLKSLTPLPEQTQQILDSIYLFLDHLTETMQFARQIIGDAITDVMSRGERNSGEEPIGLIDQREGKSE